jgi:hypothetical protein
MPSIKSDIMNKNLPSSQMREFEVSNPDDVEESQIDYDSLSPEIQAIVNQFEQRGMKIDDNVIRSLIAKHAAQMPPPMPKTMQIDDPLDSYPSVKDMEKQIQEAKRLKLQPNKSRLSPAAKKRIEMLSGLKKNTRTCVIGDYEYQLQTLRGGELKDAIMAASAFDGTIELPFETRKQLLARSLTHVAGTDIDTFLGSSSLEAKLEFLGEELDERITSRLYNEYLLLVDEVTKKYSVKTAEDAQEVTEDLKK